MPSSLILQGGAVSAKSLTDNVTQAGHGFTGNRSVVIITKNY